MSSSQQGISRYYRPCSSFISSRQGDATLVPYHRWAHGFQSATGETGPKGASTFFIRPEQSDFKNINSLQTSCFLEHFIFSISLVSITGGGDSDFLFSQLLAGSDQISFFSSECAFLDLVTHLVC